jgi:hypothetical protein
MPPGGPNGPNGSDAQPAAREHDEQAGSSPPPRTRAPSPPPPVHRPIGLERNNQQSASPNEERFRPRKGRLNYIEKRQRFFQLIYEDEDLEQGEGPVSADT